MKFHKKKTVVGDDIIISFAVKISKREIMGVTEVNTDKDPTTIKDLMEMDNHEVFLAFLRMYLFWVDVFNMNNPKKRRKKKRKKK